MSLRLELTRLSSEQVIASYGKNDAILKRAKEHARNGEHAKEQAAYESLIITGDTAPERMRALHPEAARDYLRMMREEPPERRPVVTDMFRSPQRSLERSQEAGSGALPPGESGHNFGESTDAHTRAMMRRAGFRTKAELDALFARYNFFNYWTDGRPSHPKEDYHYNHLPPAFRDARGSYLGQPGGFSGKTTYGYLKAMLEKRYGAQMELSTREMQLALQKLGFLDGSADGVVGRWTLEAVTRFQARWMPTNRTGRADKKTVRLLAYLTAEIVWVPAAT